MNKASFRSTTLAIAITTSVLALNNFIFENPIQRGFYRVFSRPGSWLVGQTGVIRTIKDGWRNADNLVEENSKLREQNFLLKSELAAKDILEKENKFLRQQLGVGSRPERRLILAKIFGVNRTPASSTLTIDKGAKDGAREGIAVITAGNILVGLIKEVFENSSVVWLADDPRLNIDVMVQSTNTLGRTHGLANGGFGIDLLSHVEKIKTGDAVLTSGLDGINEALLVGEISSTDDTGTVDLFRKVRAKNFFEIASGASVFVIIDHD